MTVCARPCIPVETTVDIHGEEPAHGTRLYPAPTGSAEAFLTYAGWRFEIWGCRLGSSRPACAGRWCWRLGMSEKGGRSIAALAATGE